MAWLTLLGVNLWLERSLKNYTHSTYDILPKDPEFPLWKLLLPYDLANGTLPIPEGCVHWFTSGLIAVNFLERATSPAISVDVINALVLTVSMWLGWLATRSLVFSVTMGLCMTFGTHFIHGYQCPSIKGLSVFLIYVELALFCAFHYLCRPVFPKRWLGGFIFSMGLMALAHEQWLDFLAGLTLVSSFLFVYFYRLGQSTSANRTIHLLGSAWLIAAIYLPIRMYMGSQHTAPGNESEMIFGYAYLSLALEDLLSNIITYNYLILTSYLPPFLTGSISDYQIGGQAIIDSQHGYHEQFSGMTAIHHVFFWRYYAGAAFVIYAYFLAKTTRRALIKFESTAVIVASLLMLIGTGAAIHWVVKFRPYLSVPLLTYRTTTGLLAVSLLLSYGMMISVRRPSRMFAGGLLVALCWIVIVYSGLSRPHYQAHLARTVGLGGIYPDPLQTWRSVPHVPTAVPKLEFRP